MPAADFLSTRSLFGAGAAGMFCAALAGQRGRRVLLVDHAGEPGRKILISGGGRCNFTNIGAAARQLPLRQSPFRQVGAAPLHARRLHRPGRAPRHRLARKDARPAVLRRLGAADRRHAAGRMRRRRGRRSASATPATRRAPRRRVPRRHRQAARRRRRRSCWPPAACRSPSSARPASPTTSRAASASRSSSRARRWCR